MPKAPPPTPRPSSSASNAPGVLKRNQACHQCRKKKLKCDATSPACSACVKTHAYAVKTHPTTAPPFPECTYDPIPGEPDPASLARIRELEEQVLLLQTQLQQSDIPGANLPFATPGTGSPGSSSSGHLHPISGGNLMSDINRLFEQFPESHTTTAHIYPSSTATSPGSGLSPGGPGLGTAHSPSPASRPESLYDPAWPVGLPGPELLHYLCEVFFTCVPYAHRVLHKPTLMNNLVHPSSSFKFPSPALLHAICASASLYTSRVSSDALRGDSPYEREKIHFEHKLIVEEDSFGLKQSERFYDTFNNFARKGDRIHQLLQASIIITWYFHGAGRAVDTWLMLGTNSRTVHPLGLNHGPLWTPLSRQPIESLSLFPTNASATEKETLRNCFWLAYCMERLYCAGTVWPLVLQDEDITQYLPISTANPLHMYVPNDERQRLQTPNMLVEHPPGITDSFTLYIKACCLLGKVKNFNGRFKSKFDNGLPDGVDPRESAEFQMLDNALAAFKLSVPREFREPFLDGKVDQTLYLALTVPHVAMLLLHDPHAQPESPNCLSSERMVTAARAILDLVYKLAATSFDLLLLDHASSFCWFVAASAIVRFLKVRILAGDEAETTRLSNELQVLRFMMSSLGQRTIIGLRQNMILEEIYNGEVQPLIDAALLASQGASARPATDNQDLFGLF